jgi:hypothetical protein
VLPLAHIGHYLWILYVLPVLIVIGGIVKTTLAQRRDQQREEGAPPAGGREGGPRTDKPARSQDPPP